MLEHLSLGRERFPDLKSIGRGKYSISKATRRVLKARRMHDRALRRIQKLLDRQYERWLKDTVKEQLHKNTVQRREPHLRLRKQDNTSYLTTVLNPYTQTCQVTPGGLVVKSESMWQLNAAERVGETKWFLDYSPTLQRQPFPLNYCRAAFDRVGSFSSSLVVPWQNSAKPQFVLRKSKWPVIGLRDIGSDGTMMTTGIAWSNSAAEKALLKAYANFYRNDLNLNEYIVEWSQVMHLLRDPLKTSLRFMHLMERWTRRDAWMWVPPTIARKLSNGATLRSRRPLGAMLMSMRTKRLVSPTEVSSSVLTEASNRWLQYRYGIAPLMDDIQTVINLATVARPNTPIKTGEGRHNIRSRKTSSEYVSRRGPLNLTFKRERNEGEFYSAKVYGKIVGDTPSTFRNGLHSSQWLRVMWNAIPYSFVFDWVCNIDTWLTSQINVPWLQVQSNCVTAKRYDRTTSRLVKAVEIYYGRPATVRGETIATRKIETIERRINLARPTSPVLSDAWTRLKNLWTGEALIWGGISSSIAKEERDRKRRL